MNKLPYWHLVNPLPSFHDVESGTVIEMTAKVYGAMNDLINEYNRFAEEVNKELDGIATKTVDEQREFISSVTKTNRTFFDCIRDYVKARTVELDAVDLTTADILQEFGDATDKVVSQDALTKQIMNKQKEFVFISLQAIPGCYDGQCNETGDTARVHSIHYVQPGEEFKLSTRIGKFGMPGYIFLDNAENIIETGLVGDNTQLIYTDYEIVAPADAFKLIVQSTNSYYPPELKKAVDSYLPSFYKKSEIDTQRNYLNAGVYISGNNSVSVLTFTKDSEKLTLHFTGKLVFRACGIATGGLDWSSISTDISDFVTIAGENVDVTIPTFDQFLVYNVGTNKLALRNYKQCLSDDIVLMINGWGNPCGGELMKYITVPEEVPEDFKETVIAAHSGVYVGAAGSDTAVTWRRDEVDTYKLFLTIPHKLRIRYAGGHFDAPDWSSISTDISDFIETDENTATILIDNYGKRLVFNVDDKKIHIRAEAEKIVGDIVLMINGYGSPCGGALMRYIDLGRIVELEAFADEMKSKEVSLEAEADEKIKQFAALFNNAGAVESFIFFTDPHLTQFRGEAWRADFEKYMAQLAKVYNTAPVDRVICGGDWLGHEELPADACYRLGLIDSTMKKYFKKYNLLVGNHDTNYQGSLTEGAARYTGRISNETIKNLWARNKEELYYIEDTSNTRFFFLDTNAPEDDTNGGWDEEYLTEQKKWFATNLRENNVDNIAVMIHIFINIERDGAGVWNGNWSIQPVAQDFKNIISAFNSRGTISVGGENFDFSNATGKIRFVMCGHKHEDGIFDIDGLPVIMTDEMRAGDRPTFDLCLADYTANKLYLKRVGTGEDRTVDI